MSAEVRTTDYHTAGEPFRSVIGTQFLARVVDHSYADGHPAVITEVQGQAFRTGEHVFVLTDRDPVKGLVLR